MRPRHASPEVRPGTRTALCLALVLGLAACASSPSGASAPGVEVLLAAPERPHEVVALLRAEGLRAQEIPRARERLLAEAAALGGDAVILYVREGAETNAPEPTWVRAEISERPRRTESRAGLVLARVLVWKEAGQAPRRSVSAETLWGQLHGQLRGQLQAQPSPSPTRSHPIP